MRSWGNLRQDGTVSAQDLGAMAQDKQIDSVDEDRQYERCFFEPTQTNPQPGPAYALIQVLNRAGQTATGTVE